MAGTIGGERDDEAMYDGPSDNDLWAALLDIELPGPAMSPTVRLALGVLLRDLYRSVLDTPTPARVLDLLQVLAAAEPGSRA